MLNLIFFGTPGAGKGTQAELIAQKYGLTHISSGQLLRQEISTGELGPEIKHYLDSGTLVPDSLISKMIEKAILKDIQSNGFIFDGYPRSLEQAKALDSFLTNNNLHLSAVFNIEINEDEAKKRILQRGQTSGRSDDNLETISTRFTTYHNQTKPLLDYYSNQKEIIIIDGAPNIETVAINISQKIEEIK